MKVVLKTTILISFSILVVMVGILFGGAEQSQEVKRIYDFYDYLIYGLFTTLMAIFGVVLMNFQRNQNIIFSQLKELSKSINTLQGEHNVFTQSGKHR